VRTGARFGLGEEAAGVSNLELGSEPLTVTELMVRVHPDEPRGYIPEYRFDGVDGRWPATSFQDPRGEQTVMRVS